MVFSVVCVNPSFCMISPQLIYMWFHFIWCQQVFQLNVSITGCSRRVRSGTTERGDVEPWTPLSFSLVDIDSGAPSKPKGKNVSRRDSFYTKGPFLSPTKPNVRISYKGVAFDSRHTTSKISLTKVNSFQKFGYLSKVLLYVL